MLGVLAPACAATTAPPPRATVEPAPVAEPTAPRWVASVASSAPVAPETPALVTLDPEVRAHHAMAALDPLRPKLAVHRESGMLADLFVGAPSIGSASAFGGLGLRGGVVGGGGATVGGLGGLGTIGLGAGGPPRAKVSITHVQAKTDLAPIRLAVNRALPRLRACAVGRQPAVVIVAQLTFAADGSVGGVTVAPTGPFASCVASALARVDGPRGTASRAASVTVSVTPPP